MLGSVESVFHAVACISIYFTDKYMYKETLLNHYNTPSNMNSKVFLTIQSSEANVLLKIQIYREVIIMAVMANGKNETFAVCLYLFV